MCHIGSPKIGSFQYMKELEFYSGDRKAANITDGGEHIFFCLTRKSKDQMSNDRNVSFMQIRYCLFKLGEGKTASDRVKCFVVDGLKSKFNPDRFSAV